MGGFVPAGEGRGGGDEEGEQCQAGKVVHVRARTLGVFWCC
ncbi:hypothetical protein IMCC9480_2754 [Oxalobacteraceae bacterium IMCC9480]|nr:hypothetical protein IMCC9480_2754 [Oxalobacteraceae bacterium IMCC9480]